MEYLFSEKRHTFLISNKATLGGVVCPVRLEVSIFDTGSVFVVELFETPQGTITLNSSHHKTMNDFKQCFKEAAYLIEQNEKRKS